MTRMEEQMAASEAAARKGLEQIKSLLPPDASPHLTAAVAALDRFKTINADLIKLSRQNSDVRSLALTLGRKRVLTAQCDDQLRGLQEALATHTNPRDAMRIAMRDAPRGPQIDIRPMAR